MDRPPNPQIASLLAEASMRDLLSLREVAFQTGLWDLSRAAAIELRRRTTVDIDARLRHYKATLPRHLRA